jgi:hypothetical protein
MTTTDKKKRFTLHWSKEIHEEVRKRAKKEGRTLSRQIEYDLRVKYGIQE